MLLPLICDIGITLFSVSVMLLKKIDPESISGTYLALLF
jgi:hypothetical protein